MKLFRSEDEVLQDDKKNQQKEREKQEEEREKQKEERELRKFYKDINFTNSKEDMEILEQIRVLSKSESIESLKRKILPIGDPLVFESITRSTFLEFYILKQLSSSSKAIDTLVEQNKELENKFDTMIKQNEELNNKFDQLIEVLKSK